MRDDYDDDGYDDRRPTFPVGVMIAGVIWIGIGALGVIGGVVNLVGALLLAGAPAGPAGAGANPVSGVCGAVVNLAIGGAFLLVGIQTVTGKAKDTLGNSIGSIVLGLLCLGLALLIGVIGGVAGAQGGGPGAPPAGLGVFLGVIIGLVSLLYLVPGILGLTGRRAYLAWREDKYPTSRRRRPSRRDEYEDDEDDDADDRPRRRREG